MNRASRDLTITTEDGIADKLGRPVETRNHGKDKTPIIPPYGAVAQLHRNNTK